MDILRQILLALCYSTVVLRATFGNLHQDTGSNSTTTEQNVTEISALLDFEAGMIYYKDKEQGFCFVEFLESVLEDSFVIRVPEPGTLSQGIEETSPLAKEFCGSYQIFWIGEFLSPTPRERKKRSPQNGIVPRGSSQSQVQGQVYGQGLFSGQAISGSGSGQAQVQLSGAGILGSVSSSAGNAQAQIALHERSGSGQAQSTGSNSNSQVQVNIENGGRGSMASASVNTDEAARGQAMPGQYYGKPGWKIDPGNIGRGRSEGLWAPDSSDAYFRGFGQPNGRGPVTAGRGYVPYNNKQTNIQQNPYGPGTLQGGSTDWYRQPNYGSPNFLTQPGIGSSSPFGQIGNEDISQAGGQGLANLPQLPDIQGQLHPGAPNQYSSSDRFGQLGQPSQGSGSRGGELQPNGYVPFNAYTPQQYSSRDTSGSFGGSGRGHFQDSQSRGHPARSDEFSSTYAQPNYGQFGRTEQIGSSTAYSGAGGSDVPHAFASSTGGGQAQAQTFPRGNQQASVHASQSAHLSRGAAHGGVGYSQRNGNGNAGKRVNGGFQQTAGEGNRHPWTHPTTPFAQQPAVANGHVGSVIDSGGGSTRPVSADGYIPFGNGYVRPYITGPPQPTNLTQQNDPHLQSRFQPSLTLPQQAPSFVGAISYPQYQPPATLTTPNPMPVWESQTPFPQSHTPSLQYPGEDYSKYYGRGQGYERPVWSSGGASRPQGASSGHSTNGYVSSETKHCRVVTFTCTVLIESNGRAKICKPNGNGKNGHHSQESGRDSYQDHGPGLRICCC